MGGSDARRKVPSVDAILRSAPGQRAARVVGRPVLKRTLTTELDAVRTAAENGTEPPLADEILAAAAAVAMRAVTGQISVINATGVILHTNLGRAPLAGQAVDAVATAAAGYTDLEVDRDERRARVPRSPGRAPPCVRHRRRSRLDREQLRRGAPAHPRGARERQEGASSRAAS